MEIAPIQEVCAQHMYFIGMHSIEVHNMHHIMVAFVMLRDRFVLKEY